MATVFNDSGKAWVAGKMSGAETGDADKIDWGTGAGTAAVGDTTLFTEAGEARVTGTKSRVTTDTTNDTYQVVGTMTATAAKTVTNAGVFDVTTKAAGDLLIKGDFTGIPLLTNDQIEFTFKLDFDD